MASSAFSSTSFCEDVDFNCIPASALNISSRMKLSWFLNPEQPLCSDQDITRDYRGLAEQMGFQYNDVQNFQRNDNPTLKILEAWSVMPNATIGHLISYLEKMDRYDVIEDTIKLFKNDAMSYLSINKRPCENPIQVAEVTSCPSKFAVENNYVLTVSDVDAGAVTYYDAYICHAEEDIEFVKRLAKYLEDRGLVMFFKSRDLLGGTLEPEAHTRLLEERCKFVLLILSPSFLRSSECEYQMAFAAGLAVEQRQRKLIPVIISPCEIPSILKFVTKLDFTKPAQDWLFDKLVQSLRAKSNSIFVSPTTQAQASLSPPKRQQELGFHCASNPIITFPPSINFPQIPSNPASSYLEIMSAPNTATLETIPANSSNEKTPPQAKRKYMKHFFENLKLSRSSSSSSTQPSTSSSATSGFHSHSGFESESQTDSKKRDEFSEDTV